MQVVIYSTTTCPYCQDLKEFLKTKGVAFTEKLIDQDEAAQKEMLTKSRGFQGVPFIVIQKDDGSEETVIGFNQERLNQVLGQKPE